MGFKNIKANNQGITIVELLIVVVVIAILAAITIVSYNGITNRANASAAASLAASVQKKAELYASEDNTVGYPTSLSVLSADSTKSYYLNIPGGAGLTAVTATTGKTQVQYVPCGVNTSATTTAPTAQSSMSASTITGALINYWDFNNSRITTTSTTPASISLGTVSGTTGGKTIGCPTV